MAANDLEDRLKALEERVRKNEENTRLVARGLKGLDELMHRVLERLGIEIDSKKPR